MKTDSPSRLSLKGEAVSVRFGAHQVLCDVDIEVAAGQTLALIGPPEAGKTVLLKCLAGLSLPDSGRVSWGDSRLTEDDSASWRARVGMAFQNDALFDSMTVIDNVAFPLRRQGTDEAECKRRAELVLDSVELAHAGDKYPSELSGGMRRRVGLARAAVIEPSIGLFDDPIAGLDPLTAESILDLLGGLVESVNMASIVVSNDLSVVLPRCDRTVMLHEGRVVYSGDTKDLGQSEHPVVYQFVRGLDEGPI